MIRIVQGDIMKLAVDAIVNAANQVMLGNEMKPLPSHDQNHLSRNRC